MSLDNVLGVAGAAKDHYFLSLWFGLSILLMAFAANYTARLIEKYSWIIYGLDCPIFINN